MTNDDVLGVAFSGVVVIAVGYIVLRGLRRRIPPPPPPPDDGGSKDAPDLSSPSGGFKISVRDKVEQLVSAKSKTPPPIDDDVLEKIWGDDPAQGDEAPKRNPHEGR